MSGSDDMMGLLREATEVGGGLNLELLRDVNKLITSPAVGRKLSRQERVASHRALLGNPLLIESQFDELSARYQLTPEKPIPRRLVLRLERAAKELAEEDNVER
jgi:hypothetical protein